MGHLISEPKFKILTPSPPPPLISDKSLRKAHSELVLSPPIDVTDGPHQRLLGFSPASYIDRINTEIIQHDSEIIIKAICSQMYI